MAATVPSRRIRTGAESIDVVSGEMILSQTDLSLPGILPLVIRRVHVSSYRWGGAFGPTWASTFDQRVEENADGSACFVAEDGVVLDDTVGGGELGAKVADLEDRRGHGCLLPPRTRVESIAQPIAQEVERHQGE